MRKFKKLIPRKVYTWAVVSGILYTILFLGAIGGVLYGGWKFMKWLVNSGYPDWVQGSIVLLVMILPPIITCQIEDASKRLADNKKMLCKIEKKKKAQA